MTGTDIPRRSVGAVTVLVPDYQEAIDYFVGTLGFTLVEDTRLSEEKRGSWFRRAPVHVFFWRRREANAKAPRSGTSPGGRVFLFLTTDDFWRDYRAYMKRGVEFQEEPRREEYGMVAVFEDRYGNRWDLIERDSSRGTSSERA